MTQHSRIKVIALEGDFDIAKEMIRIWSGCAEAKAASYVNTHIELENYDAARQWFRILAAIDEMRIREPGK